MDLQVNMFGLWTLKGYMNFQICCRILSNNCQNFIYSSGMINYSSRLIHLNSYSHSHNNHLASVV